MSTPRWTARHTVRARGSLVLLCAGALALAGCAESGSGGDGSVQAAAAGGGLPADASKADYAEALADMAAVTLQTQSPSSPGTAISRSIETYSKAVEEWSDGKIKFEIVYGNAIAGPTEHDDALADGRLFLSPVFPIYEPSEYPAGNALVDVSFLRKNTPVVGALQAQAAFLEAAWDTPELLEEYAAKGVKYILPIQTSDSVGLTCSTPRHEAAEFKGVQTRVSGQVHAAQVEALGMSPVSLPYPEIFEGLQRGVVDCAISSLAVANLGGFLPVANSFVMDPDAGFAGTPGSLAVDAAAWEELPLPAQQLLYDRLDAFLEGALLGSWQAIDEALGSLKEEGGTITPFEPDARALLQARNDELLEKATSNPAIADGDAFVERVTRSSEDWLAVVTDELAYEDEVGFADFADWYVDGKVDLTPFLDRVRDDILSEHRPS